MVVGRWRFGWRGAESARPERLLIGGELGHEPAVVLRGEATESEVDDRSAVASRHHHVGTAGNQRVEKIIGDEGAVASIPDETGIPGEHRQESIRRGDESARAARMKQVAAA